MEWPPEIYEDLLSNRDNCKRIEKALHDNEERKTLTHWVILLLIGFNYVLRDTELYLLYFLLADNLGCDFTKRYSFIMMLTYLCNLVWRPLSGYLTDVTQKYAHHVLWISTVFVLVVQTGMIFSPGFYALTAFQTGRNLGQVQMYNSIWKIFKMRLENKYGLVIGSQCATLSKVGVIGEIAELAILTIIFCIFYVVTKHSYLSYEIVKYCFLGLSFLFNIICIILALMIRSDYYVKPSENNPEEENQPFLINESPSELSNSHFPSLEQIKHEFSNEPRPVETSPFLYLWRGVVYFWKNQIAFHATLHIILIYFAYASLSNAEAISIPNGDEHHEEKTLENYCGGYFTNTFFQASAINISFLLAASFYLIILKRTPSTSFYKWMYPIAGTILLVVSLVLVFPFNQLEKSLSLAFLEGFLWFFLLYDNFLVIASISGNWFGFYSILYGTSQTILNLLFSSLFTWSIPNIVFVGVIVGFLVFAVFHAAIFGWFYSQLLKRASFHFC